MLDTDVKYAPAVRNCNKILVFFSKFDVDHFEKYRDELACNREDKKFKQPARHSVPSLSTADFSAASTS